MGFTITSEVFEDGGSIPRKFTCDDADVSPALAWDGVPEGTESFALIVDDPDAPDPDAPKMTWVHWVLYNIPASTMELPEAVKSDALPPGTREGHNDWKRTGYGGPCPPIGRHRYYFKLYALDTVLPDLDETTKDEVSEAADGHVIARAVIMGTYQRPA
jgi:Raf kinase inhibitor-like YbhB/YbcL family protein